MMTPTETAQIKKRLTRLERTIAKLEKQRVDPDSILDESDRQALRAADEDEKAGRLVPLEELKRRYNL